MVWSTVGISLEGHKAEEIVQHLRKKDYQIPYVGFGTISSSIQPGQESGLLLVMDGEADKTKIQNDLNELGKLVKGGIGKDDEIEGAPHITHLYWYHTIAIYCYLYHN